MTLLAPNSNNTGFMNWLFGEGTIKPDVVIIELEQPFKINKYVKPACLPKADIAPNRRCYASGWGSEYKYFMWYVY